MIEPMKQYHFERGAFCDTFEKVFRDEGTIDFINGEFGSKKGPNSGFNYETLNFKCFSRHCNLISNFKELLTIITV